MLLEPSQNPLEFVNSVAWLTDAVGFALLVPGCRAGVRAMLSHYFKGKIRTTVVMDGRPEGAPRDAAGDDLPGAGGVIDVKATRVETVDERPGSE